MIKRLEIEKMNYKELKKTALLAGLMTVMVGSIYGCGNNKSDNNENKQTTVEAVTTEAETTGAKSESETVTTETPAIKINQDSSAGENAGEEITTQAQDNIKYTAQNIIGTYVCERATIMISGAGGENVNIDISWGSSAYSSAEWTISGTFDAENLCINYTDAVMKEVEYGENGDISNETVFYSDGTGSFMFDMDAQTVIWNDDKENAASGMIFELTNINGTIGR